MNTRHCVSHYQRWILSISGLGLLLMTYGSISVIVLYHITVSRSFGSLSRMHVSTSAYDLPVWERQAQFLDKVAAFQIRNSDPLALQSSMRLPRARGKTVINPNPISNHVHRGNASHEHPTEQTASHQKLQRARKILVVNNPRWNWIKMGSQGLNDCPVGCSLTDNRSQIRTADAVIIYAVGMHERPPPRVTGQVWIFLTLESPIYSRSDDLATSDWRDQINWTMTYRSDSDVWYPYGRVNRRTDVLAINYTAVAERKSHSVAWFVSHCSTHSKREKYVAKLKKFVSVDIFGMCGTKHCGPEGSYECFQMLTEKYKFYLAFENALCDDYVTEKVFRTVMASDIVPIVYGRVNYTRYMPPKSFIDVSDFSNIRSLAKYLNYLNSNTTAYSEYLEWKRYYFAAEKPNPTCEICMKLTEPDKYRNVYSDIYSWWVTGHCHTPDSPV